MKTYFSTFITGFSELVRKTLETKIPDLKIDLIEDGVVVYQTSKGIDFIREIHFLNNTFLMLQIFKHLGSNPTDEMMNRALKIKDLFVGLEDLVSKNKNNFRIMATIDNRFVKMDNSVREKLENNILKINSRLKLDRTNPDVEFIFINRREGYGFLGFRLTRHTSYEKTLEKGELYPELAYILCLLSEPSRNDVFLDPFCGFGSIPIARVREFGYKEIIASDLEKFYVTRVRTKVNKIKHMDVVVKKWNALNLSELKENSIDKIVTDPPWGINVGKELDLKKFYYEMSLEFNRILKPNGVIVILIADKELFENILNKFENFKLISKYETLVSGQKAGVYKIKKIIN